MSPNRDLAVMHSSQESDWRTPDACFQALQAEFAFDVDAAANAHSSLCGGHFFGPGSPIAGDALRWDWTNAYAREEDDPRDGLPGIVTYHPRRFFLNPPFSKEKRAAWNRAHPKAAAWNPYDTANWARKCWEESSRGATIVGLFPFAPQTEWYRRYVYGHVITGDDPAGHGWSGHAALQERRLPHRISFLTPDGQESNNAGVNTAVIVWQPLPRVVGPWTPHVLYWSYR